MSTAGSRLGNLFRTIIFIFLITSPVILPGATKGAVDGARNDLTQWMDLVDRHVANVSSLFGAGLKGSRNTRLATECTKTGEKARVGMQLKFPPDDRADSDIDGSIRGESSTVQKQSNDNTIKQGLDGEAALGYVLKLSSREESEVKIRGESLGSTSEPNDLIKQHMPGQEVNNLGDTLNELISIFGDLTQIMNTMSVARSRDDHVGEATAAEGRQELENNDGRRDSERQGNVETTIEGSPDFVSGFKEMLQKNHEDIVAETPELSERVPKSPESRATGDNLNLGGQMHLIKLISAAQGIGEALASKSLKCSTGKTPNDIKMPARQPKDLLSSGLDVIAAFQKFVGSPPNQG
jgi:hypothetical protein